MYPVLLWFTRKLLFYLRIFSFDISLRENCSELQQNSQPFFCVYIIVLPGSGLVIKLHKSVCRCVSQKMLFALWLKETK